MNNELYIQSFLDSKKPVLLIVEEALNEWNGKGCMQFPSLLEQIKTKMNWDDKQVRANDPIIREFIRNHPNWHVTRGAHGGIMRSTDKQEKEAVLLAKQKVKAEINAALDLEIARKKAEADSKITVDNSSIEDNLTEPE